MDENTEVEHDTHREGTRGRVSLARLPLYFFERLVDHLEDYAGIIGKEKEVFLGSLLMLLGLLNFESDKFCDGNTANYLSCTRPSTYYYFDALDSTLIIVGVFLILIWFLRRSHR